jgi:acetyltransferase
VKQVLLDAEQKGILGGNYHCWFRRKKAEGKALEAELVYRKRAKMRILGPNCLGFMNLINNINLSFAATSPERAMSHYLAVRCYLHCVLDIAEKDNLGFSQVISVGNKCDLNENSCYPYLMSDPATKSDWRIFRRRMHGQDLLAYNAQIMRNRW